VLRRRPALLPTVSRAEEPPTAVRREVRIRVWPVFGAYLAAFAAIFSLSGLAVAVVTSLYPDVPPETLLRGLPGLLAGAIASSMGLVLTLALVVRPFVPARLRLLPGRETGRHLFVMIVGVLALGQALDSLTALAGLGGRGAMPEIRRALASAVGEELFAAVVVIGLVAGAAEELFFRAFMQSRFRARWSPAVAVVVSSACFGVMHLDWVHSVLAFALGLYLGFITEMSGSALPAIACHVVNNVLFTLATALVRSTDAVGPTAAMLAIAAVVFAACIVWLRRRLAPIAWP
jgi:membrane protease YdiL (CAAX protease family)